MILRQRRNSATRKEQPREDNRSGGPETLPSLVDVARLTVDGEMQTVTPDRHALNIARAVQREVAPDIVILFGSRATGQHREDSDVDLLLLSLDGSRQRRCAGRAASAYMNEHPPFLEVNVVNMTLAEFQRNRRAKQHLAGQADHYGVVIGMERMNHGARYEDDYPEHWPATRQRLENTAEWSKQFNDMVAEDHWNQKLMGFSAQLQVENALRGIWEYYVDTYYDPDNPETRELYESVVRILDHTTYEDSDSPTGYGNWLVKYAADYRYNIAPRPMDRSEKAALQTMVNVATDWLVKRIHELSGTTEDDVFPDGAPWE